jgi:hypothetical protein
MTIIVTRSVKGTPLTHAEMDANLNNLNNGKSETTHNHSGVYQPASANLDEYAAVNPTAAGLALLDDVDASAQLTTLGVSTFAKSILDDVDEATFKATVNLEIGVDVQAYDADIPTVAASQVEMEAGTETTLRSMSPARVKQAIVALAPAPAVPTVEVATDTDRTYSLGGTFTFTHGLSGVPQIIQAYMVCQTAELNYSIGDVVTVPWAGGNSGAYFVSGVVTSSNIVCRIGNSLPALMDKTTGSSTVITAANWKIRLKAVYLAP